MLRVKILDNFFTLQLISLSDFINFIFNDTLTRNLS